MSLTDDKPALVQAFQLDGVRLGHHQHALDPLARPFLAELHLEDSVVDGLASYLTTKQIQLAMRDFEVCCGVFVLHL